MELVIFGPQLSQCRQWSQVMFVFTTSVSVFLLCAKAMVLAAERIRIVKRCFILRGVLITKLRVFINARYYRKLSFSSFCSSKYPGVPAFGDRGFPLFTEVFE